MKLKREVILRIRDLARDLHDVYADKPKSLDLAKDERISERMKEYFQRSDTNSIRKNGQ
jgi:hypothetical protein